jgi:hypothetical protein
MPPGARVFAGLVSLMAASGLALAAGSTGDIVLVWNAPATCPDRAAVVADVRRLLGGDPSRGATTRADVVELGPERWSVRLVIEMNGVTGERSFEAESCVSLASATALILAWTIDPVRARAASRPALDRGDRERDGGGDAPVVSPPPAPSVPPPSSEPPPASRPPAPRFLRGLLAATGTVDVGALPRVAAGAEVTAGALVGPIRVEVAGVDWLSQDALANGQGAQLHMLSGLARGCYRVTPSRARKIELAPCLGGELEAISSSGIGATGAFQSLQRTTIWGAFRGDVLFAWAFAGPLALRATAGVAFAPAPPTFVVEQPGNTTTPVRQNGSLAGRGSLGLEVHFP